MSTIPLCEVEGVEVKKVFIGDDEPDKRFACGFLGALAFFQWSYDYPANVLTIFFNWDMCYRVAFSKIISEVQGYKAASQTSAYGP